MSLRILVLTLAIAIAWPGILVANPAQPDCSERNGWDTGRHGQPADAACEQDDYLEGHRLGEALAGLRTERDALEVRIKTAPKDTIGVLRRQQRQLDVDIEAIRGVATLRGWPDDVAPPNMPGAAE